MCIQLSDLQPITAAGLKSLDWEKFKLIVKISSIFFTWSTRSKRKLFWSLNVGLSVFKYFPPGTLFKLQRNRGVLKAKNSRRAPGAPKIWVFKNIYWICICIFYFRYLVLKLVKSLFNFFFLFMSLNLEVSP